MGFLSHSSHLNLDQYWQFPRRKCPWTPQRFQVLMDHLSIMDPVWPILHHPFQPLLCSTPLQMPACHLLQTLQSSPSLWPVPQQFQQNSCNTLSGSTQHNTTRPFQLLPEFYLQVLLLQCSLSSLSSMDFMPPCLQIVSILPTAQQLTTTSRRPCILMMQFSFRSLCSFCCTTV